MSVRDEKITGLPVPAMNAALNAGAKTWGALADQFNVNGCRRWKGVGPIISEQYRLALADLGLLTMPVVVRIAVVLEEARNNPGSFAVYVDKGGGR